MLRPSFRILARRWWPVMLWLILIRLESTDMASSENTGGLLRAAISLVVANPSDFPGFAE